MQCNNADCVQTFTESKEMLRHIRQNHRKANAANCSERKRHLLMFQICQKRRIVTFSPLIIRTYCNFLPERLLNKPKWTSMMRRKALKRRKGIKGKIAKRLIFPLLINAQNQKRKQAYVSKLDLNENCTEVKSSRKGKISGNTKCYSMFILNTSELPP